MQTLPSYGLGRGASLLQQQRAARRALPLRCASAAPAADGQTAGPGRRWGGPGGGQQQRQQQQGGRFSRYGEGSGQSGYGRHSERSGRGGGRFGGRGGGRGGGGGRGPPGSRPPQQQQQQQQQRGPPPGLTAVLQPPTGAGFPYMYSFGPAQRWGAPTGLAVTWLGTSSGTPTKDRNISCTLLRSPRGVFMVDCGEGSLAQLRKTAVPPAYMRGIFVTHLHGDHCFGLASMIMAVAEGRRAAAEAAAAAGAAAGGGGGGGGGETLCVYGPPGLAELLRAQMVLTGLQQDLPLPLVINEFVVDASEAHAPVALNDAGTVQLARIAPQKQSIPPELAQRLEGTGLGHMEMSRDSMGYVQNAYKARPDLSWSIEFDAFTVTAAQLQHRVPCWGYVFDEKLPAPGDAAAWAGYQQLWERQHAFEALEEHRRQRRRDAAAAAAPSAASGSDSDGEPDAAAGKPAAEAALPPAPPMPPLRPRRVVILGDTMDSTPLAPAAWGADLISHEATYARGMEAKALRAQHSTAWMAGGFARAIGAQALVLTHFSARYKAAASASSGGGGPPSPRPPNRPPQQEDVETDQGTLVGLIDEAAAEFGSSAVCTAKDLFSVHVRLKPAPKGAKGFGPAPAKQ